jgi:CheY-like chemotaxis protein
MATDVLPNDLRRRDEVRILVADDDEAARVLYTTLLKDVAGVDGVFAAADGADAVELASRLRFDIAVLDLNMPRLDGVAAAAALIELQPSLAVALHSSDPTALYARARGLGAALFDKRLFDSLIRWVESELAA